MANKQIVTEEITNDVTLAEIETGNIPQSMIDECSNGKGDNSNE